MKFRILIITILSICSLTSIGQNAEIDSLKKLVESNTDDSIKLQALSDLNWLYINIDLQLSKDYGFQELVLSIKNDDQKWIAQSYNDIGISNFKLGLLDSALYYYDKSLAIRKSLNDKSLIASSLSKKGVVYQELGNFNKSLENHLEALKIFEEANNENYQAMTLNNISVIYEKLNNVEKTLFYGEKALAIHIKNNNEYESAHCYANLASVYKTKKDIEKSKDYLQNALDIYKKYGDKSNEAATLNSFGLNLRSQKKDREALKYYKKAFEITEQIDDKLGMALYGHNLGSINLDLGNYLQAEKYSLASIKNTETSNKYQLSLSYRLLSNVYSYLNDGKKSKYYFDSYVKIKDSLYSIESSNQIAEMEVKYETEKKDKELIIKDAEIVKQQADASKKAFQRNGFIIGFFFILVFSIIVLRMFRQKRKANIILALQKEEIEEKNRDILDSIHYAKTIQTAILPPNKVVKEYLKNSFILYKPKDIVAGDFYWMEHKDGKILFAAADCTGHGVPGAMVSVLCNNGLNRSVREHGITDPGKILDKTREIVIQEFEKSEDEVKDGMDIALCSLEGFKLQYAGAYNPLWIIRNGEILETKADKQPIGKSWKTEGFTTHTIDLQSGDTIYIFSDGYVDQFGGEKAKKFKSKAFKELLISIQDKQMEDQRLLLDENFENWRGKLEQIDDVCVIGVKI